MGQERQAGSGSAGLLCGGRAAARRARGPMYPVRGRPRGAPSRRRSVMERALAPNVPSPPPHPTPISGLAAGGLRDAGRLRCVMARPRAGGHRPVATGGRPGRPAARPAGGPAGGSGHRGSPLCCGPPPGQAVPPAGPAPAHEPTRRARHAPEGPGPVARYGCSVMASESSSLRNGEQGAPSVLSTRQYACLH
jgi:hypothetical protein